MSDIHAEDELYAVSSPNGTTETAVPGNPFTEGTVSYRDYEVMSDLQWHCMNCEVESGQAKTFQRWRDDYGLVFQRVGKNYSKLRFCDTCRRETTHRRLLTLDRDVSSISRRTSLSPAFAARVKTLMRNVDAYSNKTERADQLEIDHRVPQIRWSETESENTAEMTDSDIQAKFMLLTRSHNLLKSRSCERCVETGERGTGYGGLAFWVEGGREWEDTVGCVGCFWFDPEAWRAAAQAKLDS